MGWLLAFGWVWITLGLASGTVIGLYFHKPGWLGGYDSLARRMVRLGHIAMVMLGVLSILFVLTVEHALLSAWERDTAALGWMVGALTMPTVCFLTAWRAGFRRLFFVPVIALLYGSVTVSIGTVKACVSG